MRGLAIAVGALLTTAGTAGAAAAGPVLVSGQLGGTPFATKAVAAQTVARTAVAGAAAAALTYAPPVAPMRVLRGFEPPSSPYGPGHRGVDLALGQGGLVAAAGDGAVSFAGLVAGRGVVVLRTPTASAPSTSRWCRWCAPAATAVGASRSGD